MSETLTTRDGNHVAILAAAIFNEVPLPAGNETTFLHDQLALRAAIAINIARNAIVLSRQLRKDED